MQKFGYDTVELFRVQFGTVWVVRKLPKFHCNSLPLIAKFWMLLLGSKIKYSLGKLLNIE